APAATDHLSLHDALPIWESAARRLWHLWHQGQQPNLAEYLSGAGPLGPLDLAAVLRVDQRQRWLLGQRLPAEQYLAAYTTVAARPEEHTSELQSRGHLVC